MLPSMILRIAPVRSWRAVSRLVCKLSLKRQGDFHNLKIARGQVHFLSGCFRQIRVAEKQWRSTIVVAFRLLINQEGFFVLVADAVSEFGYFFHVGIVAGLTVEVKSRPSPIPSP